MGDDVDSIKQLLATLTAAADAFARAGNRIREAGARFELGRYLFQMGRGDAAFGELCRAAELFQKEGASLLAAQALLGCAHALTIQNRREKSLEWFDKSIDVFSA